MAEANVIDSDIIEPAWDRYDMWDAWWKCFIDCFNVVVWLLQKCEYDLIMSDQWQ